MTTMHWGEIPKDIISDFFIPDVAEDIEKSMDKFCLAEYEDDSDKEVEKTEQIILPSMDPLMLYAISLHKYTNDMTEMIQVAELAIEKNLIPPKDAAPPMPIMPAIDVKHKRNSLSMPSDTPFAYGWETDVPELGEIVVKKVVTKCIVTMFAHVGFETTHQSVLDTMTDVLENFFKIFCGKIVEAINDEESGNNSGFPHVIEKVLTDTGMGGVKGLNDYYQNRIIKYINVLQKRCSELNDRYAALSIPKNSSPIDKVVRVKVEDDKDVVEMNNPEVHFTAFDGETSVLETGYQLLNNLEAEEKTPKKRTVSKVATFKKRKHYRRALCQPK